MAIVSVEGCRIVSNGAADPVLDLALEWYTRLAIEQFGVDNCIGSVDRRNAVARVRDFFVTLAFDIEATEYAMYDKRCNGKGYDVLVSGSATWNLVS